MTSAPSPPASPEAAPLGARPTGVTVVGALSAAFGALVILFGLLFTLAGGLLGAFFDGVSGTGGLFAVLGAALGIFLLAYGVFLLIIAFGLFRRARWAWYATVVIFAIGAVSALFGVLGGDVFFSLAFLLIDGYVVWYFLSPAVQAWFGVGHKTPWTYKAQTPGAP